MNFNYDEPVKNLPDAYRKDTGSNNCKILQIGKDTADLIASTRNKIFDALNLNNAKGQALDDIWGSRVNLERDGLSDDQYRIRLRFKIMKNLVDGTFPKLTEALAYVLECSKSEIHIQESTSPNSVKILDISMEALKKANFENDEIVNIINELLPVNVKVEDYNFSGTFMFAETDNEYDEKHGFSDDTNNIGGYLGLFEKYTNQNTEEETE